MLDLHACPKFSTSSYFQPNVLQIEQWDNWCMPVILFTHHHIVSCVSKLKHSLFRCQFPEWATVTGRADGKPQGPCLPSCITYDGKLREQTSEQLSHAIISRLVRNRRISFHATNCSGIHQESTRPPTREIQNLCFSKKKNSVRKERKYMFCEVCRNDERKRWTHGAIYIGAFVAWNRQFHAA